MRKVYICKRRFPKKVGMEGSIHKDPHENSLIQCTTRSNDSWVNGSDPFALLFHLNNADGKPIVPSWLSRPPKVEWKSDETGKFFTVIKIWCSLKGEVQGDYILKYAGKDNRTSYTSKDILIASTEHIDSENSITVGSLQRMLNKTSLKGP